MNQRTPHRRLGLSRISPRIKRSNDSTDNTVQTTSCTANENIESKSEPADDFDSLVTPTKKIKVSPGCFHFTPKQPTNYLDGKHHETVDIDAKTVDELNVEIREMNELLEKYEKYNNERKELQQLIETWKDGGVQALRQLQIEIQPKQEIEQILEHFKLPVDIFGNISD